MLQFDSRKEVACRSVQQWTSSGSREGCCCHQSAGSRRAKRLLTRAGVDKWDAVAAGAATVRCAVRTAGCCEEFPRVLLPTESRAIGREERDTGNGCRCRRDAGDQCCNPIPTLSASSVLVKVAVSFGLVNSVSGLRGIPMLSSGDQIVAICRIFWKVLSVK